MLLIKIILCHAQMIRFCSNSISKHNAGREPRVSSFCTAIPELKKLSTPGVPAKAK